ncbi:MAG: hypothetical protein ABIT76_12380 [Chthoniobacterales bacterium]
MSFRLLVSLVVYGSFASSSLLLAQERDAELPKVVVSVDDPSPLREVAETQLKALLPTVQPKAKPESTIAKTGEFVLVGDLFKNGGTYALAELHARAGEETAGVAFVEWIDGQWELRGLWKIETVWRPKEWKWDGKNGDDYLPIKPATEPFKLVDLSGDGVPEVIFAGEVEKYYQEHYLLRFDPAKHRLNLVASAMGEPQKAGKYVRLDFNSGRRAIWGESQFFEWSDGALIKKASWHDEVGYGTNDPTFVEGEGIGKDDKLETIRVGMGHGADMNDSDPYVLTKNEQPYGTLSITWKAQEAGADVSMSDVENRWLFEKITRLPAALYPDAEEARRDHPLLRFEDVATVQVTGAAEAEGLFRVRKSSPKPHR